MTRKDKIMLSNSVFFLTAFIAVWILFVKTNPQSHIVSTVSYADIFTLLIPILLVIISVGFLNVVAGTIILYEPVLITLKKTVHVKKYKSTKRLTIKEYPAFNYKSLCVFRC